MIVYQNTGNREDAGDPALSANKPAAQDSYYNKKVPSCSRKQQNRAGRGAGARTCAGAAQRAPDKFTIATLHKNRMQDEIYCFADDRVKKQADRCLPALEACHLSWAQISSSSSPSLSPGPVLAEACHKANRGVGV